MQTIENSVDMYENFLLRRHIHTYVCMWHMYVYTIVMHCPNMQHFQIFFIIVTFFHFFQSRLLQRSYFRQLFTKTRFFLVTRPNLLRVTLP